MASIKLYNINWPSKLREDTVKILSAIEGAVVRTASYTDNESGYTFFMLDVSGVQEHALLSVIQSEFVKHFETYGFDKAYGFTLNDNDFIVSTGGLLRHFEAFRNIPVDDKEADYILDHMNNMLVNNCRCFKYRLSYDFYLHPDDIPVFVKLLQEVVKVFNIHSDITYIYCGKTYNCTQQPKVSASQKLANYSMHTADCPKQLIADIEKLLKWYAATSVSLNTTAGVTRMYFTASKRLLLKALKAALAVYCMDAKDYNKYTAVINNKPYVFSCETQSIIPVTSVHTKNENLLRWLEASNIFYRATEDNSLFVDKKQIKRVDTWLRDHCENL